MNEQGQLLAFALTPGHRDDRRPVQKLVRPLWGKRFGDRGYLSQERFEQLWAEGLPWMTKRKRNRKNQRMPLWDQLRLRQRALIEGVNDQWKNSSPIEHTRHRHPINGLVNLITALVASTFQPKKPALDLFTNGQAQQPPLPAVIA
jgi:Transposase DDE domain